MRPEGNARPSCLRKGRADKLRQEPKTKHDQLSRPGRPLRPLSRRHKGEAARAARPSPLICCQRDKCHSRNPKGAARFTHKLRMILSGEFKGDRRAPRRAPPEAHEDPFSSARSFPPVLVCSLAGTVVSLASVWLEYRAAEADLALVSV